VPFLRDGTKKVCRTTVQDRLAITLARKIRTRSRSPPDFGDRSTRSLATSATMQDELFFRAGSNSKTPRTNVGLSRLFTNLDPLTVIMRKSQFIALICFGSRHSGFPSLP